MTARTLLQQGGPAYPVPREFAHLIAMAERENADQPTEQAYIEDVAKCLQGPTLRDYFAAKAMASLITEPVWNQSVPGTPLVTAYGNDIPAGPDRFAVVAYRIADAMLKARQS